MDNENKIEEEQILDAVEATEDEALDEAKKAEKAMDGEAAAAETAAAVKKSAPPQAKAPTTKTGMINAMVGAMKGMKKADLQAGYGKIMASMKAEGFDVEAIEEAAADQEISFREIKQISAADLNVEEDVKAIFGSEELTEEFKEKATTVFEAAVVSKVNEILETVTVDLEAELEADKEEIHEGLAARLDDYLEYVAEEWMKENELAVEQGIRADIVENFMTGLRNLFNENYIDIPEEKVDLVDELAAKVEEQEAAMNEEIDRNIELRKALAEAQSSLIFKEVSEGLTETQAQKLKALAEGVEFEGVEEYSSKLSTLKESYFADAKVESLAEEFVMDDEPIELEEENAPAYDASMAAYMNAISRTIKK